MSEINEREAFEKWLGIKPCGAAHDFGWAAWMARAALAATPAAAPEDMREKVALALGLSLAPKGAPRFAWSYLLGSIRDLVKREEELVLLKAGEEMSKAMHKAPAAAPVVLPEPVGYLVTKLEAPIVGSELKINRSIYTKNEPTGKHQKLYTEQQVRALLCNAKK